MGLPLAPTTPHLYSPSLQLKLYQAFIFSIPILFSIILFLLFYLFYLKRRNNNNSSSSLPLSRTSRTSTQVVSSNSLALMGLKGVLKEKLPVIIFDGNSRMKETQCCVCLGEFELKEELNELPSCQHVFHKDCIHHWFHSSSTCPLCRCPVVIITPKTIPQHQPPDISNTTSTLPLQDNNNENINLNHHQHLQDHHHHHHQHDHQQDEHVVCDMMSVSNCIPEQHMPPAVGEGSSTNSTTSMQSSFKVNIQRNLLVV